MISFFGFSNLDRSILSRNFNPVWLDEFFSTCDSFDTLILLLISFYQWYNKMSIHHLALEDKTSHLHLNWDKN